MVWLWAWFAKTVGVGLDYCVRRTNPRHAVALYFAINAVTTMLAFVLTQSWPDFFTVASYWVTSTGFVLASIELYRTRALADIVARAVRRFQYRFCLDRARVSLSRARDNVQAKQWTRVIAHLDDLTEHLSFINSISPAVDDRWQEHVRSMQGWIGNFGSGTNGRRHPYNESEWGRLVVSVLQQLDDELAPFQYGEGTDNDIE